MLRKIVQNKNDNYVHDKKFVLELQIAMLCKWPKYSLCEALN